MDIVKKVLKEVKEKCKIYKENSLDNYDFWENHLKYVYQESQKLAIAYHADTEVVALGSLLHDIALICQVGDKKDHHLNGVNIAQEILRKYNYKEEKIKYVLSTICNHRSSKYASCIEDLCVADADILAHFDNLPMLFNLAFNQYKINLNDIKSWLKKALEKDFNDLSDMTKENFKERYQIICDVVIGRD